MSESIEQRLLTYIQNRKSCTIDELYEVGKPSMPPTVSRKLRKLTERGLIRPLKGSHGANVIYEAIASPIANLSLQRAYSPWGEETFNGYKEIYD